jgi:hypothetical protein
MPLASPTVHPSSGQLLAATLAAILVAGVILVTVVWPAEFGIDPTGIGGRLGLFRPAAAVADATDATVAMGASTTVALVKRDTPFRTDEVTITLKPGEGTELKAAMTQGDRMVFSWTATGAGVDVDMHGDDGSGAEGGVSTSYWKDEWQTSGHGSFEAGFAGNHGWFWQNLNDEPVTVTVKVSGYYRKLFRP